MKNIIKLTGFNYKKFLTHMKNTLKKCLPLKKAA